MNDKSNSGIGIGFMFMFCKKRNKRKKKRKKKLDTMSAVVTVESVLGIIINVNYERKESY